MEEIVVTNNPEKHRFEAALGDGVAFIDYTWHKGSLVAMHTYVPETHRGMGIAGKMIKQMLEYLRANNIKLIVHCPAVAKYMESRPEYDDLLDTEYKGNH